MGSVDLNVTLYSGSSTDEEETLSTESLETYVVPGVFAVFFIVGVLGNGTLALIFVRHKCMRNIPNTFIFNLAMGDLLVIFTCVPFTAISYILESWPWGETICQMSEAIKCVSIGVSVFTLTALSAERYFIIVNPIPRRISTKPLTVVTVIWVASVMLALPSAVLSSLHSANISDGNTIVFCLPFSQFVTKTLAKRIVMFKFLTYCGIPFLFITAFYILMARHLVLSTRSLPGEHGRGQSNQIQARKKVAKMVLAFVVIFIICFFPQHIFMLWFYFNPNAPDDYNVYWHIFRVSGFYLSFLHSCVNPIALYICSESFRKYFNRYLLCY